MVYVGVDWIQLAQDMTGFMMMVMNLQVPQKWGIS
jgi:hypothetical protein